MNIKQAKLMLERKRQIAKAWRQAEWNLVRHGIVDPTVEELITERLRLENA